jgi:hypothetical protein
MTKAQPPTAAGGRFAKDSFAIDLRADTVTCPAGLTVPIRRASAGSGTAAFGAACATCPLAAQCATSAAGRTIAICPREAELARARARQADPAWQADYKATRPKVERKIAHLTRRSHGGRRARMRGRDKIAADFSLLAAAANLARLATLGLARTANGWAVNPHLTPAAPHQPPRKTRQDRPAAQPTPPTAKAGPRTQPTAGPANPGPSPPTTPAATAASPHRARSPPNRTRPQTARHTSIQRGPILPPRSPPRIFCV